MTGERTGGRVLVNNAGSCVGISDDRGQVRDDRGVNYVGTWLLTNGY
ncbi:MAG: hypothetical protein ACLUDU_11390 [Butyricimonas faecihominis]